jgi:hypothetical protein
VIVQPSTLRIFNDYEYEQVTECLIVCLREMPDHNTGRCDVARGLVRSELDLGRQRSADTQAHSAANVHVLLAHNQGTALQYAVVGCDFGKCTCAMSRARSLTTTQNIRLIDYEKIVNDNGQRLVRFGRYAGYAGMIDFLHGLGNRMLAMGYSSPFLVSAFACTRLFACDWCLVIAHRVHAHVQRAGERARRRALDRQRRQAGRAATRTGPARFHVHRHR